MLKTIAIVAAAVASLAAAVAALFPKKPIEPKTLRMTMQLDHRYLSESGGASPDVLRAKSAVFSRSYRFRPDRA